MDAYVMAKSLKRTIDGIETNHTHTGIKAVRLDMWDNVSIEICPYVARIETGPIQAKIFYDSLLAEADGTLALIEKTGPQAIMPVVTIDCTQIDDITHVMWEED